MSKTAKTVIIGAVLLIIAGVVCVAVFNRPGFTGNRVVNPDSYTLDIERMHGTDRHAMELSAGDELQVHCQAEKGSLHMEITAPDGSVLYSGNGREISDFTVVIPENGVYSVTVEARHAKGTVRIRLGEDRL